MRPAQMDVRLGNQRRKRAAALLMQQLQAQRVGGATAGLGGVRQTGGLARAGAKAGIIRGQGRGIPAGLEGLYARAGDFARANQLGDYQLNAEQQPGAVDPGQYAGDYAAANTPSAPVSDPGGQGGQQAGTPAASPAPYQGPYAGDSSDPTLPVGAVPNPDGSVPTVSKSITGPARTTLGGLEGKAAVIASKNPNYAAQQAYNQGMRYAMTPEAQNAVLGFDLSQFQTPGDLTGGAGATASQPAQQGGIQDGTPMNGGVYYQGTVIPMAVWRSLRY